MLDSNKLLRDGRWVYCFEEVTDVCICTPLPKQQTTCPHVQLDTRPLGEEPCIKCDIPQVYNRKETHLILGVFTKEINQVQQ